MTNPLRRVVLAAALILLSLSTRINASHCQPPPQGCRPITRPSLRMFSGLTDSFYFYFCTIYVAMGCEGSCSSTVEFRPQVADVNGVFPSQQTVSCSSNTTASCCKPYRPTVLRYDEVANPRLTCYNWALDPITDEDTIQYIKQNFVLQVPLSCRCERCDRTVCQTTTS